MPRKPRPNPVTELAKVKVAEEKVAKETAVKRKCLSGIGKDHWFKSRGVAHRICPRCRQTIRCRLNSCPAPAIRTCHILEEGI